ncbi:MAG: hypothetical protein QXF24_08215, partial [Thermoproteota archaeon]
AGWLAAQGGSFLEFSVAIDGHKADYLRDDGSIGKEEPVIYADGRGEVTRFGEVATEGAIAVRRLSENQVEIINVSRKDFGLNSPFGMRGVPASCEVFNLEGEPLGSAEVRLESDYAWITARQDGHRYLVSYSMT